MNYFIWNVVQLSLRFLLTIRRFAVIGLFWPFKGLHLFRWNIMGIVINIAVVNRDVVWMETLENYYKPLNAIVFKHIWKRNNYIMKNYT